MLVFVDESGDSGFKFDQGSSEFLTIGLVVFENAVEATACSSRIDLLKNELGWAQNDEFHFIQNSDRVRIQFLESVSSYRFYYFGTVINKKKYLLLGKSPITRQAFYILALGMVFDNAKSALSTTTVVFDQSDNVEFKRLTTNFIRKRMNKERYLIKTVKMQRSESNNLIQLADYVASSINRSMSPNKKFAEKYRKLISPKEKNVEIWPK